MVSPGGKDSQQSLSEWNPIDDGLPVDDEIVGCLVVVPENQYVFEVRADATKVEIKRAVEGLFEVDVEQVQVLNMKGKQKSFRLVPGRQKGWKKAYVRVQAGQSIEQLNAD